MNDFRFLLSALVAGDVGRHEVLPYAEVGHLLENKRANYRALTQFLRHEDVNDALLLRG